jgi:hypothetical protein
MSAYATPIITHPSFRVMHRVSHLHSTHPGTHMSLREHLAGSVHQSRHIDVFSKQAGTNTWVSTVSTQENHLTSPLCLTIRSSSDCHQRTIGSPLAHLQLASLDTHRLQLRTTSSTNFMTKIQILFLHTKMSKKRYPAQKNKHPDRIKKKCPKTKNNAYKLIMSTTQLLISSVCWFRRMWRRWI